MKFMDFMLETESHFILTASETETVREGEIKIEKERGEDLREEEEVALGSCDSRWRRWGFVF